MLHGLFPSVVFPAGRERAKGKPPAFRVVLKARLLLSFQFPLFNSRVDDRGAGQFVQGPGASLLLRDRIRQSVR